MSNSCDYFEKKNCIDAINIPLKITRVRLLQKMLSMYRSCETTSKKVFKNVISCRSITCQVI